MSIAKESNETLSSEKTSSSDFSTSFKNDADHKYVTRNKNKMTKKLIIRIDLLCPNVKTYYDQVFNKQSLKKISFEIDRSINKINENDQEKVDQVDGPISTDMNTSKDQTSYKNTYTCDSLENAMDLIYNTKFSPLVKSKTYSGIEDSNSFKFYRKSNFGGQSMNSPKKLDIFRIKKNSNYVSFISKKLKGIGCSAIEIIKYEHELFRFSNVKASIEKIENSKLSVSMFRDSDSLGSVRAKLNYPRERNLNRTKNLLFDFKTMDLVNRDINVYSYISFNKNFYRKMCQMDANILFKSGEVGHRQTIFEISLGDGNNNFGYYLNENIKYEHFYDYVPLYIDLLNEELSNDEILNLINYKLETKLNEIDELSIDSFNLKFPINFISLNSEKANLKINHLREKNSTPEFFLISYQVRDQQFEPLDINLIKRVRTNYAIMNGTSTQFIREAIEKCIGQNLEEMYKCNFFKMYNYVILIKKPVYKLNNVVYDKDLMENFNLVFDSDYNHNVENVTKKTTLVFHPENGENIKNETKINNSLIRFLSTQIQRENSDIKKQSVKPNITRKRIFISSNDKSKCEDFIEQSLLENQSSDLNKNNNNQNSDELNQDKTILLKKCELNTNKMSNNNTTLSKVQMLKAKFENQKFSNVRPKNI